MTPVVRSGISKVLVATLVAIAGAAAADPKPSAAPPPQVCKREGAMLLVITERADQPVDQIRHETTVYDTGAWHYVEYDLNARATRDVGGCLSSADLKTIRDELAHAPWKVSRSPMKCDAMSETFMQYTVRGKLVWTSRLCQYDHLDATTDRIVGDLTKRLGELSAHKP